MIKQILNYLGLNKPSGNAPNIDLPVQPAPVVLADNETKNRLYNFKEVSVEEIQRQPNAISDIFTGKSDGFLIKNFMKPEDVDALIEKINEIRKTDAKLANVPEGFTYPMVFAEYNNRMSALPEAEQEEAVKNYFLEMEKFNINFASEYGIDAYRMITDFFKSLGGGRNVEAPKGVNDIGRYPFVTYRYLVPDQGLMSIHCANYFGTTFTKAYSHLNTKIIAKDQMSYFIMLLEPEAGGELSLFNFRWQDGQTKKNAREDNEIIQPDGSVRYVQTDPTIQKNKIRPAKGDMILFQGGNIWHRIERIKGTIPRITFGGFLSFSHDDKTIYYWS